MTLLTFGRIAAGEIGFREDPARPNMTPYGDWYGMDGQPYCAMGISWAAAKSGDAEGFGGKFAYCPYWVHYFQNAGRWSQTPERGALVFFNFGYDLAVHVGWVEQVLPGNLIQTVEWNTSSGNLGSQNNGDGVFRRIRSTLWGVEGYGHPRYNPEPVSRAIVRAPIPAPVKLTVDGAFGPNTVRALQKWLAVPVDGAFGPQSKKALQRRLRVTADGVVGTNTIKALQRLIGTRVDGAWGPNTTSALQTYLNKH